MKCYTPTAGRRLGAEQPRGAARGRGLAADAPPLLRQRLAQQCRAAHGRLQGGQEACQHGWVRWNAARPTGYIWDLMLNKSTRSKIVSLMNYRLLCPGKGWARRIRRN